MRNNFYILVLLILTGCNDDSVIEGNETFEPSIEFSLSSTGKLYHSTNSPFNGLIVIPVYEDTETKIANYIKLYSFDINDDLEEEIKIKLHHIIDVFDERPTIDSLFSINVMQNNASYIIDQSKFLGFGITVELSQLDGAEWQSYETVNANQDGSAFDIYEIVELDTATFVKARFNLFKV